MDSGVSAQRGHSGMACSYLFDGFCMQLIKFICVCLQRFPLFLHNVGSLKLRNFLDMRIISSGVDRILSLSAQKLIALCVGFSCGTIAWEP